MGASTGKITVQGRARIFEPLALSVLLPATSGDAVEVAS